MKKTLIAFLSITLIASCSQSENKKKKDKLALDELTRLSESAWIFGLPLVLVEKQFDYNSYVTNPTEGKAPVNQFGHIRRFVDASNHSVVGFNADHLYSFASIDLSEGPLVLSIPEMGDRYWLMQLIDAWNGVPASPGAREYGGKARNFVIVGPDFKGDIPKELEILRSPTNLTMIGGRTYCVGSREYSIVNKLQDQYKLTPLAAWGKRYSPPNDVELKEGVDGKTAVNTQVMALSAEQFFKDLNRLMLTNPPYPADGPVLQRIAKLGIKPGAEFSMDNFSAEEVKAIEKGVENAKKSMMDEAKKLGINVNNWLLTYDMGRYGTRYAYRAAWTYFGIGGNVLEDAFYPLALSDKEGGALKGEHSYTLTFAKGECPPVQSLWSLTMYDIEGYLVENPLNRYSRGDRSNMKPNADSSLTIYIQNQSPGKEKENNWLPSPKSGPFKLALRLYSPEKQVIDKVWVPPAIVKVQSYKVN